MDTPVVRLRCGHCGRLLRLAYVEAGEWIVQTNRVGTWRQPHGRRRVDRAPRVCQVTGIIRADQRLQFTCPHRNGKTRTIPLRHDTLQRLCEQAVTTPRREVLL